MNDGILGFNGELMDPVSGTTHLGNGYRAYNPTLMRFNCPDSMSPCGSGGINPYAYCAGDPVTRADPSGHFSLGQWIGMGVALVAGIALSFVTEGAAMPAMIALMSTVAGNAIIGAGGELMTEAIDGQRVNWKQVGTAVGISAAASLVGFGLGKARVLYQNLGRFTSRAAMSPQKYYSIKWGLSEFTPLSAPEIGGSSVELNAAFAFVDEAAPGSRRLNICGHGSASEYGMTFYNPDGSTFKAGAHRIIDELKFQGLNLKNLESIRLVSCHGADNGLAQTLSEITYLPVLGFHGTVHFNFPKNFFEHIVDAINISKNEYFRIIDNGQTLNRLRTENYYYLKVGRGYAAFVSKGKITTNYPEWFFPQKW